MTNSIFCKINVRPSTKEKIEKIAKKNGTSQVNALESMCEFFIKTGIDPKGEYDSMTKSFAHLERFVKNRLDTFVGFTKENEKRYLMPIREDVMAILDLMAGRDSVVVPQNRDVTREIAPPIADNLIISDKDEKLFATEQERDKYRAYLDDLVSKIEVKKSNRGNTWYELKISEGFYDELKTLL